MKKRLYLITRSFAGRAYVFVMFFFILFLTAFSLQSMQQPDSTLAKRDPKEIELAVYKKFFLPPEVREFFELADQGDAHPFPRTLLVDAPYSMRPSLIARAIVERYGDTARYEKFHGWHPTVCADMQKVVTTRLEQDSRAPLIVHLNDLSRAGRDLYGKKQPGCSGVVENMTRFLHRYFGREGEWKNSPVILVASATDMDMLSAELKAVFEKTVRLTPPAPETRRAALGEFLHLMHKLAQPEALAALGELSEGASFEELRKWSEALSKRALLVPTAIINTELVDSARFHVQPQIVTDREDEKKLREQLSGLEEQKNELTSAKKKAVLADLVQPLIPSIITTLAQKITEGTAPCPIKLVLLSGPKGVGKRTAAHACAATIGAQTHELSLKELFNPNSFVQDNGMLASVNELKKKIRPGKKGVVLIEDIDLATQVAGSLNSVDRGLLELRKKCLQEVLQAVQTSEHLMCIATTSDINAIDHDIRNAFYCQVPCSLPDKRAREALLAHQWRVHCEQQSQTEAPDFKKIAEKTEDFSCQNLTDLLGHAVVLAYLENKPVETAHLEKSLKEIVAEEKSPETPVGMYR